MHGPFPLMPAEHTLSVCTYRTYTKTEHTISLWGHKQTSITVKGLKSWKLCSLINIESNEKSIKENPQMLLNNPLLNNLWVKEEWHNTLNWMRMKTLNIKTYVSLRTLLSVMRQPGQEGRVWRTMDASISLRCTPKAITVFFINWLYPNTNEKF